jgi:hypothetical protein
MVARAGDLRKPGIGLIKPRRAVWAARLPVRGLIARYIDGPIGKPGDLKSITPASCAEPEGLSSRGADL